jgi:hypothetical protein
VGFQVRPSFFHFEIPARPPNGGRAGEQNG